MVVFLGEVRIVYVHFSRDPKLKLPYKPFDQEYQSLRYKFYL